MSGQNMKILSGSRSPICPSSKTTPRTRISTPTTKCRFEFLEYITALFSLANAATRGRAICGSERHQNGQPGCHQQQRPELKKLPELGSVEMEDQQIPCRLDDHHGRPQIARVEVSVPEHAQLKHTSKENQRGGRQHKRCTKCQPTGNELGFRVRHHHHRLLREFSIEHGERLSGLRRAVAPYSANGGDLPANGACAGGFGL